MRALVPLLALVLLSVPAQASDEPLVECDVDDDLYQHCRAGPLHWVTGPWCAGVRLHAPAECWSLRDVLA